MKIFCQIIRYWLVPLALLLCGCDPTQKIATLNNGGKIGYNTTEIEGLCELAKTHEAQIWIERVGALSGELPGVVIEDGAVAESTRSQ